MCGIVAYIGNRNCKNILIGGLKRLEYRGYDSAGIAIMVPRDPKKDVLGNATIKVVKDEPKEESPPVSGPHQNPKAES